MPSYRNSHRLPSIFRIDETIQHRRELQARHRARLAKPIEEMRYLDRIVTVPGCRYTVQEKDFASLTEALEYCRRVPLERWGKWQKAPKGFDATTIFIIINNPAAPEEFRQEWIPAGLTLITSKDALCVYARERVIVVAADLSEVYTESFDLDGANHLYDYGVLYGNYPVYTGKELCVSSVTLDLENMYNIPFVPEPQEYGIKNPNAPYKYFNDLYMTYVCYPIDRDSHGHVYDDWDFGIPVFSLPVSSFCNIGLAGVYWDCWDMIWDDDLKYGYDSGLIYRMDGVEEGPMFRSALLACKEHEVPEGQAYYKIHVTDGNADGLLPDDLPLCSLREIRSHLIRHAKRRTLYISPAFDAVYWETFTLTDTDGKEAEFFFDYALLKEDAPSVRQGELYRTIYWNTCRLGNPLTDATVYITAAPDGNAPYTGGAVDLRWRCRLENGTEEVIPAGTVRMMEEAHGKRG